MHSRSRRACDSPVKLAFSSETDNTHSKPSASTAIALLDNIQYRNFKELSKCSIILKDPLQSFAVDYMCIVVRTVTL